MPKQETVLRPDAAGARAKPSRSSRSPPPSPPSSGSSYANGTGFPDEREEDEDTDVLRPEDEIDVGTESGYDTDPVDRFFKISAWQSKLSNLQRQLKKLRPGESGAGGAGEVLARASKRVLEMREKGVETVGGKVQEIKERQQEAARRLNDRRKKVVGSFRERQRTIKQHYEKQVFDMRGKVDKVLAKARSARARQLRHMVCVVFSMVDVVITAFWLGASPQTSHLYYSLKCMTLIGLRAIWYRVHGWHYYLFDLCYCSNGVLLLYIWLFSYNEILFTGVYGFSGVLLISVALFRNSFVPHSLDRVTSVQVHVMPAVQMWAIRWYCKGHPEASHMNIPDSFSIGPSCGLYAMWITTYVLDQFIIERKRIERKGFATLFNLMAYDMGILKMLPKRLQGPVASRCVFVVGHFTMFFSGLPFIFFPFSVQTIIICLAILLCFKNGASFYMTYFYKVYDQQIHAFEKQMKEMEAAESKFADADEDDQDHDESPESGRLE